MSRTSNRSLARCIEVGLHHVQEDHDVFLGKSDQKHSFCGCALASALERSDQLDRSSTGRGWHLSDALIKAIIEDEVDAIRVFAYALGISKGLASKIDKLHRQDRIPAKKIAEMLRKKEI